MEYQKSAKHGVSQRPDIVVHVPTEFTGGSVREGNLAVYALKRRASAHGAHADFDKLDEMLTSLRYEFACFINIDTASHHLDQYTGGHCERVYAFAVRLAGGLPSLAGARFVDNRIVEIDAG